MKHTMLFPILLGTILFTACSLPTVKTSWSKPGASPDEFERAQAYCEVEQGEAGLQGDAGFEVCMKRKGWFFIEETVQ